MGSAVPLCKQASANVAMHLKQQLAHKVALHLEEACAPYTTGTGTSQSAQKVTFSSICLLASCRQGVPDLSLHCSLQGDWILQDVPEDC